MDTPPEPVARVLTDEDRVLRPLDVTLLDQVIGALASRVTRTRESGVPLPHPCVIPPGALAEAQAALALAREALAPHVREILEHVTEQTRRHGEAARAERVRLARIDRLEAELARLRGEAA